MSCRLGLNIQSALRCRYELEQCASHVEKAKLKHMSVPHMHKKAESSETVNLYHSICPPRVEKMQDQKLSTCNIEFVRF